MNDDKVGGDRKLVMPVHIPEMVVETSVGIRGTPPSGKPEIYIEQKSTSPNVQFSYPHEVAFTTVEAVEAVIWKLELTVRLMKGAD
jgi:hypothetical protein